MDDVTATDPSAGAGAPARPRRPARGPRPADLLPTHRRHRQGRRRRQLLGRPRARRWASSASPAAARASPSLSIMRLLDMPPGRDPDAARSVRGRDLLEALATTEMRRVRGNDIAMIFQEPMTSLNPVFTIGDQIAEARRAPPRRLEEGAPGTRPSRRCARSASATPSAGSSSTRTSCRAACASAR